MDGFRILQMKGLNEKKNYAIFFYLRAHSIHGKIFVMLKNIIFQLYLHLSQNKFIRTELLFFNDLDESIHSLWLSKRLG